MRQSKGRPTNYKEEYCNQIIDYFSREPQQILYKKTYYSDGTLKSEEPIILPAPIPTFQEFAERIGVHTDTLVEWTKVHESFAQAYERARQSQEKIWMVNGMSGLYNSQFVQFFGKNCLGYKDRQEIKANLEGAVNIETALKKVEGDEF